MDNNKGQYQGKCNITSCDTNMPATWFNHSTQLYYCPVCARRLNSDTYNHRDAIELYGHSLCTI